MASIWMNRLGLIAAMLLLSGCSFLSPVNDAKTTYVLNTVPSVATRHATRSVTLFVTPPDTNAIYNTTKMVYAIGPHQVAYFAKNSWAETPSKMLQPLMVQALQQTHYFRAVSSSALSGHYDYVLNSQLLALQQNFYGDHSEVQLTLRAQLINSTTGKVVAAKAFSVTESALQNNPYGGVVAANKAAAQVLRQLTRFCLRHI